MIQNSSSDSLIPRTDRENIAAALVVNILTLTSFVGNGIVLLSYILCRKLRNQAGNCLIGNLALSDFMCAMYIQMPMVLNLANPKIHLTGGACIFQSILTWTIMTSSNWTLAMISAERAFAINRPFLHINWVTTNKARFLIVIIWIYSLMLATCLMHPDFIEFNGYELMCTPTFVQHSTTGYFAAVLCFWMPSTVLLVCNISIIYAVRHLKCVVVPNCPGENSEKSKMSLNDNTKTLRSLYLLVVVYFLCTSPYFFVKFSFVTFDKSWLPKSLFVMTIVLMFAGSTANPFIYAILRKDHREACLKCIRIIRVKAKSARSCIPRNVTK